MTLRDCGIGAHNQGLFSALILHRNSRRRPKSVPSHLSGETRKVRLIPMLDEFAVSDAPDVDVAPRERFTGRLEHRRARTKLDGMTMR